MIILTADYSNPSHQQHIGLLMNEYAQDPMGGGEPLPQPLRDNLGKALAEVPGAFSLLSYIEQQPAGLVNCFTGFSTFKCKPLINIHDVIVAAQFRGMGIATKMVQKVAEIAKARNCCKITLEVLSGNTNAQRVYQKLGYAPYQLDPALGSAQFWEKPL